MLRTLPFKPGPSITKYVSPNKGRHAIPKEVQRAPEADLPGIESDSKIPPSRRHRVGRIATIATLGAALAAYPSYLAAKAELGNTPPVATSASDTIHALAKNVLRTYDTTLRDHADYGHTADGGKQAILKVDTQTGPIAVTVSSTQTIAGPNKKPIPDYRHATAVTASQLLPGGGTTASLVDKGGVVEIINTAPSDQEQSQEVIQTTIDNNGIVTTFRQELMGHRPPAQYDRTPSTAISNLGAAATFIAETTTQIGTDAGSTPGVAGSNIS